MTISGERCLFAACLFTLLSAATAAGAGRKGMWSGSVRQPWHAFPVFFSSFYAPTSAPLLPPPPSPSCPAVVCPWPFRGSSFSALPAALNSPVPASFPFSASSFSASFSRSSWAVPLTDALPSSPWSFLDADPHSPPPLLVCEEQRGERAVACTPSLEPREPRLGRGQSLSSCVRNGVLACLPSAFQQDTEKNQGGKPEQCRRKTPCFSSLPLSDKLLHRLFSSSSTVRPRHRPRLLWSAAGKASKQDHTPWKLAGRQPFGGLGAPPKADAAAGWLWPSRDGKHTRVPSAFFPFFDSVPRPASRTFSSLSPVRGAQDFPPLVWRLYLWLFDKWRQTASAFGFQEFACPVVEYAELYMHPSKEATEKGIAAKAETACLDHSVEGLKLARGLSSDNNHIIDGVSEATDLSVQRNREQKAKAGVSTGGQPTSLDGVDIFEEDNNEVVPGEDCIASLPASLSTNKRSDKDTPPHLYSFADRSNRLLALRPELTPSLCRLLLRLYSLSSGQQRSARPARPGSTASDRGELSTLLVPPPFPVRWSSIGECWRYERAARGRRRQHWQWNVDIITGPAEPLRCVWEERGGERGEGRCMAGSTSPVQFSLQGCCRISGKDSEQGKGSRGEGCSRKGSCDTLEMARETSAKVGSPLARGLVQGEEGQDTGDGKGTKCSKSEEVDQPLPVSLPEQCYASATDVDASQAEEPGAMSFQSCRRSGALDATPAETAQNGCDRVEVVLGKRDENICEGPDSERKDPDRSGLLSVPISSARAEAEVLAAAVCMLQSVGLGPEDVEIRVGSRRVVEALLVKHGFVDGKKLWGIHTERRGRVCPCAGESCREEAKAQSRQLEEIVGADRTSGSEDGKARTRCGTAAVRQKEHEGICESQEVSNGVAPGGQQFVLANRGGRREDKNEESDTPATEIDSTGEASSEASAASERRKVELICRALDRLERHTLEDVISSFSPVLCLDRESVCKLIHVIRSYNPLGPDAESRINLDESTASFPSLISAPSQPCPSFPSAFSSCPSSRYASYFAQPSLFRQFCDLRLQAAAEEVRRLFSLFPAYGLSPRWLLWHPLTVRGLGYYSGIVFEAFERSEHRHGLPPHPRSRPAVQDKIASGGAGVPSEVSQGDGARESSPPRGSSSITRQTAATGPGGPCRGPSRHALLSAVPATTRAIFGGGRYEKTVSEFRSSHQTRRVLEEGCQQPSLGKHTDVQHCTGEARPRRSSSFGSYASAPPLRRRLLAHGVSGVGLGMGDTVLLQLLQRKGLLPDLRPATAPLVHIVIGVVADLKTASKAHAASRDSTEPVLSATANFRARGAVTVANAASQVREVSLNVSSRRDSGEANRSSKTRGRECAEQAPLTLQECAVEGDAVRASGTGIQPLALSRVTSGNGDASVSTQAWRAGEEQGLYEAAVRLGQKLRREGGWQVEVMLDSCRTGTRAWRALIRRAEQLGARAVVGVAAAHVSAGRQLDAGAAGESKTGELSTDSSDEPHLHLSKRSSGTVFGLSRPGDATRRREGGGGLRLGSSRCVASALGAESDDLNRVPVSGDAVTPRSAPTASGHLHVGAGENLGAAGVDEQPQVRYLIRQLVDDVGSAHAIPNDRHTCTSRNMAQNQSQLALAAAGRLPLAELRKECSRRDRIHTLLVERMHEDEVVESMLEMLEEGQGGEPNMRARRGEFSQ